MSIKINKKDREIFKISGIQIPRGVRRSISLESSALYDNTKINIPVEIIRGKRQGPVLFISAAVHGDELNGVEIIRRLLRKKILNSLKGTLIIIPIVNVFGFNNKSRYLPDRRDLNRSFPGSSKGSLASQIANILMTEIVSKCTHGIDLHTGAIHRTNLPQIRASLDNKETQELAEGFGVPVVINSKLRDGSLREAARKKRVTMLLFEGGQALRFEENVIRAGVKGCMSVMRRIGMLKYATSSLPKLTHNKIFIAKASYWIRAPRSGTFMASKRIGDMVKVGDVLGIISDPLGKDSEVIYSQLEGILIGLLMLPLVNSGDAMFHVATFKNSTRVINALREYEAES
jgi:predicted deacylase